ncbi:MAG: TIM barrel protein [Litorivicinaceae bacterium]|nr:TIM barrel protein [Litorivicinaceae bacterium]
MKNPIGVMQGRLLPKYKGRYQAHPVGYWRDEFRLAQSCGLDCIEFILDFEDAGENPLLKTNGIIDIQHEIKNTGVNVLTVCADYFMSAPLHSEDSVVVKSSHEIMIRLINAASALGVGDIVLPCVDNSSLVDKKTIGRFIEIVSSLLPLVEEAGLNLSLETDLAPKAFAQLLDKFSSCRVTVNYDIGNSAALGFDPVEELAAYGQRITDIHVKDRTLGGGPVILGKGDANFDLFFNALDKYNYSGPFIMQAYRDDEGVSLFKSQLQWINQYLKAV